jgi:hypothetical protein
VAAKNIISSNKKTKFDYKTKGMMAEIGKRTGVGIKSHGFAAWWLWRTCYLGNLPTIKKKLKVTGDWTYDLISKPDVARFPYEQNNSMCFVNFFGYYINISHLWKLLPNFISHNCLLVERVLLQIYARRPVKHSDWCPTNACHF